MGMVWAGAGSPQPDSIFLFALDASQWLPLVTNLMQPCWTATSHTDGGNGQFHTHSLERHGRDEPLFAERSADFTKQRKQAESTRMCP